MEKIFTETEMHLEDPLKHKASRMLEVIVLQQSQQKLKVEGDLFREICGCGFSLMV